MMFIDNFGWNEFLLLVRVLVLVMVIFCINKKVKQKLLIELKGTQRQSFCVLINLQIFKQ